MSDKLGRFSPFQLVYFGNLTMLDISGMTFVDAQDFLESVKSCKYLKEIRFTGCVQFHECQIVKMLSFLKDLEIVDGTSTREIQYINAFWIVSSLNKLRMISLEPKSPHSENNKWEWLVKNYNNIIFGHAIMRMFPYSGRFLRQPADEESD